MTKENRQVKKHLKRLQAIQMKYFDLQDIEISISTRYTSDYISNHESVNISVSVFKWKGADVEVLYSRVIFISDYVTEEDNEGKIAKIEDILAQEYDKQVASEK